MNLTAATFAAAVRSLASRSRHRRVNSPRSAHVFLPLWQRRFPIALSRMLSRGPPAWSRRSSRAAARSERPLATTSPSPRWQSARSTKTSSIRPPPLNTLGGTCVSWQTPERSGGRTLLLWVELLALRAGYWQAALPQQALTKPRTPRDRARSARGACARSPSRSPPTETAPSPLPTT